MRGSLLVVILAHLWPTLAQFCLPPEVVANFAKGCVPPPAFVGMLTAGTTKHFAPNPPGEGGSGTATARIWQILNDATTTSDKIMHAIMHNANTRDTGDDFEKLPHRETGEMPPTFPANYKEVFSDAGKSKCSGALSFYKADAGSDACISFLTYIGAPVSIKRDTVMHAIIHNSNVRDTLADFQPLPHPLTGLLPEDEFPKNFEDFWDEEKWPVSKITPLLTFYMQEPLETELLPVRYQFLEYIGAPVTLIRDTIIRYMQHNQNSRFLNQDFKKLPHQVTGVTPTIPYPKNWNSVMSGEFTAEQITDLLKFYYQEPVSEDLSAIQIQLMSFLGAAVD